MIALHVIRLFGTSVGIKVVAQIAFWRENMSFIVSIGIFMKIFNISHYDGSFRDCESLVSVFFGRHMWDREGDQGAGSMKFFDKSPNVWKIWRVFPCR